MLDHHSLGLFFWWECSGVHNGRCGRNLFPPYTFPLDAERKELECYRINCLEEFIALGHNAEEINPSMSQTVNLAVDNAGYKISMSKLSSKEKL